MTDGKARLDAAIKKTEDWVASICKNQRRTKMPEERESLCRKCEMWAEVKCASNPETHIIGRCRIAPWDSTITEVNIVVECPDFGKKE